jgi:lipopolysaccharide/colanic/teichoic acid biosynthesis glycosyltransferase
MAKRLFDIVSSSLALVVLSPVFLLAALGVFVSDPGPVIYRANRIGYRGKLFTMFKFRSMRREQGRRFTASGDDRIFPFGAFIRKTKIDELPQLVNVLLGTMSVIGPRPEDPYFVEQHYTECGRRTLNVKPGLASPGSLFDYTHGSSYLGEGSTEEDYVNRLLPTMLALEVAYVEHQSFAGDLKLVVRTVSTIAQIICGRGSFPEPPEMTRAREILSNDPPCAGHPPMAGPRV